MTKRAILTHPRVWEDHDLKGMIFLQEMKLQKFRNLTIAASYGRMHSNSIEIIPGGAATCSEGCVVNFLKVPLACWGSSVAAVQPNSLGNSQKTSYKTSRNKWPPHLVEFLGPT